MRLVSINALVGGLALATAASSAPSPSTQLHFASNEAPSVSIASWLSSSIASLIKPVSDTVDLSWHLTHHDKSIYDVITERPEFSKLAKAVNYSSEATKALLRGDEGKQLTLFAPKNWESHRGGRSGDNMAEAQLSHVHSSWALIDKKIDDFKAMDEGGDDDDDERRRRRRRMLAHFIDAVLAYHLVDSDTPLKSTEIAQNSTVATKLSINGKAAEYIGHLNDGLPLRIRVGKSLLPKPGVYLNFYSRVVYPDVELSNGILHAVDYPLFQFPSILQGLFFTQPEFSTLTSAFQKTKAEGYLALPPMKHPKHNSSAAHHHHGKHPNFSDEKGTEAATLFAPSNLAWDRLPWGFRAYLFSPWGEKLLGKILMLHSIPNDIVYADSVHHVNRHDGHDSHVPQAVTSAMGSNSNVFDSPHGGNVTRYTVDSVLPKLKHGEPLPPPDKAKEFEQVDVEVYRYYLLPGNKGPLQTRIAVQGVPVVIQDVVNLNGAQHLLTRFIKPKGHPHEGVWADVAREASALGFGDVDLVAEASTAEW